MVKPHFTSSKKLSEQYAEKAIAANKGIADSTITTQAYMLDLDVQVDSTGKATVTKLGEIQQAAIDTQRTVSRVSQPTSPEQPEISAEQQATNDHWDDFKAKMKARTDQLNAKSQARGTGGGNASYCRMVVIQLSRFPLCLMLHLLRLHSIYRELKTCNRLKRKCLNCNLVVKQQSFKVRLKP